MSEHVSSSEDSGDELKVKYVNEIHHDEVKDGRENTMHSPDTQGVQQLYYS